MILDSAARLAPTSVADAVAFEVGAEVYTWDDVVLAATLWGEWQQVRDQVRTAMSFVRDLQRREAAPSEDEIEGATDEFRYAHDLITAEETETWLSRRGLDFDALLQFVERALARRWSALRFDPGLGDVPTDNEVEAALWSEAVCSGWLGRLAGKLAVRAAVHERLKGEAAVAKDRDCVDLESPAACVPRLPHTCPRHAETGAALGSGVSPLQRFQWLQHLDQCFNQHCRELVTPAAVCDEIRLHQLDWVRVRVCYALFGSEDTAREAILCVSQDHRALDEAAERGAVSLREDCFLLEEIDEETRGKFLSARPNDLLGPLPWAGRHGVFLVLEKRRPSEDDADTINRAKDSVLARLLQDEVERHVRWQEQF